MAGPTNRGTSRPRALAVVTLVAMVVLAAVVWLLTRGMGGGEESQGESVPAAVQPAQDLIPDAPRAGEGETERAPVGDAIEDESAAAARGVLDVHVVSSVHGGHLAGVDVVAYRPDDSGPGDPARRRVRGTSDRDGRLRLELDAGVAWTLDAEPAMDHGYAELDVEPLAPGEERAVELPLPTAGDVPWFGRVTVRGESFAGARVRLFDLEGDDVPRFLEETESDPTGLVRLDGSSWVALEVRVRAPGVGRTVVDLVPGHETPATAQELPLWPVATLRCTVVDPTDGPVPGVEVRAQVSAWQLRPPDATDAYTVDVLERAVTDTSGVALLTDVPAELPVSFELRRGDEELLEEERAVRLAAGVETQRKFVIGTPGRIDGRVTGVDGEPLGSVQVDLNRNAFASYEARIHSAVMQEHADRSTTTDADGRFVFAGVPYGPWYVGTLGSDPEVYALAPRVELTSDQPNAEVTLRLERGLTIEGAVVDEAGAGVGRCPVQGWNDTHGGIGRLLTEADGSFAFEPMPPGLYHVWASGADGYVVPPEVAIAAGTHDCRFVLRRGLALCGTVVDAISGAPVPSGSVSAFAPESDRPYASHGNFALRDGRFELTGLPPGEIALRAQTETGGLGILRGIRLQPGVDAPEVTVRLHAGIPVRVRYVGAAPADLAIQALQDGVAVTYVATKPGETTTFHAMPGSLFVRAIGEGVVATDEVLVVAPGDHPEIVLGDGE